MGYYCMLEESMKRFFRPNILQHNHCSKIDNLHVKTFLVIITKLRWAPLNWAALRARAHFVWARAGLICALFALFFALSFALKIIQFFLNWWKKNLYFIFLIHILFSTSMEIFDNGPRKWKKKCIFYSLKLQEKLWKWA